MLINIPVETQHHQGARCGVDQQCCPMELNTSTVSPCHWAGGRSDVL